MAGITFAANDPPEPEDLAGAPRPDLTVVAGVAETGDADLDENVLSAATVARLSRADRHRIAAFIHNTLADLEELGEPG